MKIEPTLERAIEAAGRLLASMLKIRSLALRIRRRQDAFTFIVFNKSRRHHLVRPYSLPEQLRWASEAMDVLREAVRSEAEHKAVIGCSKLRLQELRAEKNLPYDSAGIAEVLYAWQRARRELQRFGDPKAFAKASREVIALLEVDALKAALRTDWRVARVVGQQQVRTGANANSKISLDAKALALFAEDTTLTKTAIAERLGVPKQSLSPKRCPRLDAAMRAAKAPDPGARVVHGSKDCDGNLEAWSDE